MDGAAVDGAQIRAARALLGWTAEELAQRASVSYANGSARRARVDGVPNTKAPNLFAIQRALDVAGIPFLDAGDARGGGLGVRFKA